jgi:hypothetical protein
MQSPRHSLLLRPDCRCRFIVDFFVGPAAQVWVDIEALLATIVDDDDDFESYSDFEGL